MDGLKCFCRHTFQIFITLAASCHMLTYFPVNLSIVFAKIIMVCGSGTHISKSELVSSFYKHMWTTLKKQLSKQWLYTYVFRFLLFLHKKTFLCRRVWSSFMPFMKLRRGMFDSHPTLWRKCNTSIPITSCSTPKSHGLFDSWELIKA